MPNQPQKAPVVLQVKNLSVELGGQKILSDINLDVQHGSIHAILGPNGAGKTTFIRCLTGSLPHKGTITFHHYGNGRVGYVPQLLEFDHSLPLTVSDFLMLMLQKSPILFRRSNAIQKQVVECLEKTNCSHLADRLIGGLSGGEMRRVLLAQALTPLPEVLLLDEPASNIDEVGARSFEKVLTSLRDDHGIAIIMVSHDLSTVTRIADNATGIKGSVTWAGAAKELHDHEVLEKVFGVQVFAAKPGEEIVG